MAASADDLPPVKRTNSIEWLPPDLSGQRADIRIILIGKTGSGKSSLINTILGREEFEVSGNQRSLTKRSQRADAEVDGRRVSVVDTPGLFRDSLSHDKVHDEMTKSISLLDPGPNAFLLVSNINHFTEEDGKTLEQVREVFGRAAERFTMVLFTGGDKLKSTSMTIEEFIENDCPDFIKKLIQDCGGRHQVFDNQDEGNRSQVSELIIKIEDMLQTNGGGFYTREMLQERQEGEGIRRIVREEMENLQRQTKELKEMMKKIEDKILRNEESAQKPKQPEETENISSDNQEWIQIINNMKQKIKAESESKKAIQKELEEAREELKREKENWKKREKELWQDRFQETEQIRKEAEMKMKKLQEEYAEERRSIERRREEEERKRKEEEDEALRETCEL